jgi:hypothetical protein
MQTKIGFTAPAFLAVCTVLCVTTTPAMASSSVDTGTAAGISKSNFEYKDDVFMSTCGVAQGAWYLQITEPGGSPVLKTATAFNTDASGFVIGGTGVGTCGGTGLKLAPFDSASNTHSCVYKLWISQDPTFPTNNSTKSNFKTCNVGDEETPTSILSGLKFYDSNHDGVYAPTEAGIQGVKITITYTAGGGGSTSVFTLADGTWTGVIPSGNYTVCEDKTIAPFNALWEQTLPANNGCYSGIAQDNLGVDNLNFGNVATITGTKYYDLNVNGNPDGGTETTIDGVRILICTDGGCIGIPVTTSTLTSGGGKYKFYLPSATSSYQVCEVVPGTSTPNSFWSQTGPLNPATPLGNIGAGSAASNTVKCWTGSGTVSGMYFTNVCYARPSGGLSHGYWEHHLSVITSGDLTVLNGLHLRKLDGTDRDFTGSLSQNQKDLANWTGAVNATNMSYMLSVQLTSAKLSTLHGLADTTVVDATPYGLGVVTIAKLFADADALLAADGSAVTGDANRAIQEKYKNVFDALVNNQVNFVNAPGTCSVTYPL